MGVKDTKAKEFLSDNFRFADLCNYYLFQGEMVIRPEDLKEQDTTELLSVFGMDEQEVQIQKWRDILKRVVIKRTETCTYAIIGIENQSDIHYAMPVRNMIYDALNYGRQITETGKKKKEARDYKNSAEFLSQFGKEDRLTPVVTLTLYWGADEWDGPRSIHEMLLPMEEETKKYVADYKLNLIVPSEITDFEKFKSSLGPVLAIIKASQDEETTEKLVEDNPVYRNLEREAVSTIKLFTKYKLDVDKEEKEVDMCDAWEAHMNRGIREGRKEAIINLVLKKRKKGYPVAEIADFLEEDAAYVQRICDIASEEGADESNVQKILEKLK